MPLKTALALKKYLRRTLALMTMLVLTNSAAATIDTDVFSKITIDKQDTKVSLASNQNSAQVTQNFVERVSHLIDRDQAISIFNETQAWEPLIGEASGTHLLRFAISSEQFTKGKLSVKGAEHSSLYLNQSHIKGEHDYNIELLNQDYRALLVVSGVSDWKEFSIEWSDDAPGVSFVKDDGKKRASMKHYYDSETVGTLSIYPDGDLLLWSKQSYSDLGGDSPQTVFEIIDLDSQNTVYRWQGMRPSQATWAKDSQSLVFMHQNSVYQLTRDTWQLKTLATDIAGVRGLSWLSESELLVSWHKAESKPHAFTKRYRALEDRWNYWRGDTQLHVFDINSGLFKQLTNDNLPASLQDIDVEQRKALITRRPVDYAQAPHALTQLFLLDINSGEESLLGEFRTFNAAHFHEQGYLIQAGPNLKNASGSTVSEGMIANDYDGQIYVMDSNAEAPTIKPLSKEFNPAIAQVEVLENGDLVMLTTDQDRRQLYHYDFSKSRFKLLNTELDVVSGFSVSQQSRANLVYKGTRVNRPQVVKNGSLRAVTGKTLFDASKRDFANIEFVDVKDWDYTTESEQFIDGRVYYPADFDANKQYPAIIYYYAGTLPVSRAFTGRWPFSMWASQGYVVYVLQPSGTIGYGQEFSARHVNAWGINTADEIIESTKAFVEAHPFVDKNRLGNMGASYGGFMTMYLATKTDMFAASISHAGISNLTSYWGHGWWGYSYSGIATRNSFPWNKTDFYTEQSPVFSADNVSTPMLLIHGDADTNVPVGESHQMYTALKLLGQDVELIEFEGDDHHINSRERRMRWWQTILAYYDMKLKEQPLWWETLYPEPQKD